MSGDPNRKIAFYVDLENSNLRAVMSSNVSIEKT